MNRSALFAAVRTAPFPGKLTQSQVEGLNNILDEAERRSTPRNNLAYALATVFHETAATMQPIRERGEVNYFNKYEPGTRIGKMLGNTIIGDGYHFRGRGYVQLTGRRNYALASKKLGHDFLVHPDDVLLIKYALEILFVGMAEGWFTGKADKDYIDALDESDKEDLREYINDRHVINGTDKAAEIGGYALKFEHALISANYSIIGNSTVSPPTQSTAPITPPTTTARHAAVGVATVAAGGVAIAASTAASTSSGGHPWLWAGAIIIIALGGLFLYVIHKGRAGNVG